MKKASFQAELQDGHKGPAVIVPFDPKQAWGRAPTDVESETYGVRPGHLIQGTLNGHAFEGWIGNRWDRHFILVDKKLQRAAKLKIGDLVDVAIAPRRAARARPSAAKTRTRSAAKKTSGKRKA